jgi:Complex I intermediate-associated protein 30 (CIA30)
MRHASRCEIINSETVEYLRGANSDASIRRLYRRSMIPEWIRRSCLVSAAALVGGGMAQSQTQVIADFDSGKTATVSGLALWPYSDEQFGGTSEAPVTLIHPGADSARGAARLSFTVTTDSAMPFAGVWAMVGPEGLASDLSAFRGVRFYARSKDATAFVAGIVRFPGVIVRYAAPLEIRSDWTLVELPFDRFQASSRPGAPDASGPPPMDPKDITSIGVSVAPRLQGQFELDIDRIELDRERCSIFLGIPHSALGEASTVRVIATVGSMLANNDDVPNQEMVVVKVSEPLCPVSQVI